MLPERFLEEARTYIDDSLAISIIERELPEKLSADLVFRSDQSKYLSEINSLPIDRKEVAKSNKANNKLRFDYRGSIVDNQTNYFIGKPIRYNLDNPEEEGGAPKYGEDVLKFFLKQSIRFQYPKKDKATSRMAAITGASGRLYYVSDETVRFLNLERYEYLIIKDTSTDETLCGMRYYTVETEDKQQLRRVEFYDKHHLRYYIETATGSLTFVKDTSGLAKPHLFDYVPLVEFPNDDYCRNDFRKVETLIDAYNKTASLNLDELEYLRNSYLAVIGAVVDQDTIELMKQTGVINFPDGGDAKYVIRNLNPELVDKILTNLEDKIFKLSATIDFNSKDFTTGGAESGESRKYKLIGMEGKAMDKENSFRGALDEHFNIITSGWRNLRIVDIDPSDIYYEFSRNLPVDLLYWAEVLQKLGEMISQETRFDLMPFIPNTQEEIRRIEKEKEAFQTRLFGDENDTEGLNDDEQV